MLRGERQEEWSERGTVLPYWELVRGQERGGVSREKFHAFFCENDMI